MARSLSLRKRGPPRRNPDKKPPVAERGQRRDIFPLRSRAGFFQPKFRTSIIRAHPPGRCSEPGPPAFYVVLFCRLFAFGTTLTPPPQLPTPTRQCPALPGSESCSLPAWACRGCLSAARAQTAPVPPVDAADRAQVVDLYRHYYLPDAHPIPGWTGNVGNGAPGSLNPDFVRATLRRINYYRAMSGLPGRRGVRPRPQRLLPADRADDVRPERHLAHALARVEILHARGRRHRPARQPRPVAPRRHGTRVD